MNTLISKKLIKVSFVVLLGFMVFTISCKKDDVSNTLNGTIWKSTINGTQDVFTFSQNTFTWMETTNGTSMSISGNYTYDHPNVVFQPTSNGAYMLFYGTVSDNSMTITIGGVNLVLTKQ